MTTVLLVAANPAAAGEPIPPHGAEIAAGLLREAGIEVQLVAPFLFPQPQEALAHALDPAPDHVAFSIRNLDDALVVRGEGEPSSEGAASAAIDTRSFVPQVVPLVERAVAAVGRERVILGGPGFSAAPWGWLRRTGARWGLYGPADDLLARLAQRLARGEALAGSEVDEEPRLLDGDALRDDSGGDPPAEPPADPPRSLPSPVLHAAPVPRHGAFMTLARIRGGRLPVRVAAGCSRRCAFCVEPAFTAGRVALRPVEQVVAEVQALHRQGFTRFWLTGSELNVPDERHAVDVLRGLAATVGRLDLRAFLQPGAVSDELLDAMEQAGLDPESVNWELGHLHPDLLSAGAGPASRDRIDALVDHYLRRGYRTLGGSALFGGHPRETDATVEGALAAARELDAAFPEGLGLMWATGARVYPHTPLAAWVRAHPREARPRLYGGSDPWGLDPVVYCHPGPPRALLARVRAGLAGCRGTMAPLNAGAPALGFEGSPEPWVNLGILQMHAGAREPARFAFDRALSLQPGHPEALARSGMLLANLFGEMAAARERFEHLLATLPSGDPRRTEVEAAIRACEAEE